jgi:hypothetical protein
MLKTKSGLAVINTVPVERMLFETDAPFTFKVQHIKEIEKELMLVGIKNKLNFGMTLRILREDVVLTSMMKGDYWYSNIDKPSIEAYTIN